MKAIAPAVRSVNWSRLSGAPDSDVTAPPAACPAVGACPASPGADPPRPAGHARRLPDGRGHGRAEQEDPGGVGRERHRQHHQQHVHDDRDELGDQQPGPADRADQQVAQRAPGGLARDRVARHDRHRDRQEHRQHERQRGRRVERPVLQHGGQERAALAGRRDQVGDRDEDRHHERQRAGQHDADPGARPAQQLDQLNCDHEIWSDPAPVTESTMSSSVRCCGPIELTRSPAPTSLVLSAAASE